jgi:hypothetical protein
LKIVPLALTTSRRSARRGIAAIPDCVGNFKSDVATITASCLRVRKARCEHEQRYEYLRRVAGIYSATTRVHATFFPRRFFQDGFCKTYRCEGAQERTRVRPLLAAFAFGELRKIESTAGRDVEFLASSPSRSAIEQVDRTINKKASFVPNSAGFQRRHFLNGAGLHA